MPYKFNECTQKEHLKYKDKLSDAYYTVPIIVAFAYFILISEAMLVFYFGLHFNFCSIAGVIILAVLGFFEILCIILAIVNSLQFHAIHQGKYKISSKAMKINTKEIIKPIISHNKIFNNSRYYCKELKRYILLGYLPTKMSSNTITAFILQIECFGIKTYILMPNEI